MSMTSRPGPQSFTMRLREALLLLFGRLPARLTTVDALTSALGELAQTRAELAKMAKAAAEARNRLSVVELKVIHIREENERFKLEIDRLSSELFHSHDAASH